MPPLETLGPALRALREAAGLSQDQVAAAMGAGQRQVSRYEAGDADPRTRTLLRFLDAVGSDLAELQRAMEGQSIQPRGGGHGQAGSGGGQEIDGSTAARSLQALAEALARPPVTEERLREIVKEEVARQLPPSASASK
jgi:transcriptional regulator with XRE-family HTH domain